MRQFLVNFIIDLGWFEMEGYTIEIAEKDGKRVARFIVNES